MRHWLFVCSRNRLRSPTVETIFADLPDTDTASAGTSPDADNMLTGELIEWADTIFVMERVQERPRLADVVPVTAPHRGWTAGGRCIGPPLSSTADCRRC